MVEALETYKKCVDKGFGRVRLYIRNELEFMETSDQQLRLKMLLDDIPIGIARKIKEKIYETSERIYNLQTESGRLEQTQEELYQSIKKEYLGKAAEELQRMSTTYLWSEDKFGELVSEKLLRLRKDLLTKIYAVSTT